MNLPDPNYSSVTPGSIYGLPNPGQENFTSAGYVISGGFGPKKPRPSGHRGAGQRPVVVAPIFKPPTGYCLNKVCNLNSSGGCCPGYGCRQSTGLAVGLGTCQRVSGGPR